MKKSEWKVSTNVIGAVKVYQVYRVRNVDAVDHSGNREYDKTYKNKSDAEKRALELNASEGV